MIRLRLLTAFLGLLAGVMPLQAQRAADSASHELIVGALRQLESKFSVEDWKYNIEAGNRVFKLYRLDEGKRLVLKASVKGNPSFQTINRFNEKTVATTRVVKHEKLGVMVEAGVDCQLGITEAGLKKLIVRFVNDIGEFEAFLVKNQDPGDEVPKVGKKEKLKVPMQITPDKDDKELLITFPTGEEKWETAWKIIWDMETATQASEQGLKFSKNTRTILFKIKKAYFKPGQKAEWIQVIEDAHPQEFYVPYYFSGTRFYDLRDVGGYVALSPKEGGAVSQVLSAGKRVIAELRDTGVAYKHGTITRRSEELTLFANFAAANYTYMVEYGFRDDGGIVFRHSPTGYNFFSHFNGTHMHGSYWRIGMKLGPEGNNDTNQVYAVRLPTDPKEQADGKGKLNIEEITTESFLDWNPREFTRLRVTNPNCSLVSTKDKEPIALPISYDLVTYPQGVARHERFKDEKFTHHDFWITRHDCPEKMYVYLGNHFFNGKGEPKEGRAPLEKKNVVLWHSSSGLHTPRSEDGIIGGNNTANGQAMIYWTTFELRPRNLFLKTPIYRVLP